MRQLFDVPKNNSSSRPWKQVLGNELGLSSLIIHQKLMRFYTATASQLAAVNALVCNPPKVAAGSDSNQQLPFDLVIDNEFGVAFEIFMYRGFGIVSTTPRAVRKHIRGQVLHYRVEDDAIAT